MMDIPEPCVRSAKLFGLWLGVDASTYADAIGRELWEDVEHGRPTTTRVVHKGTPCT